MIALMKYGAMGFDNGEVVEAGNMEAARDDP